MFHLGLCNMCIIIPTKGFRLKLGKNHRYSIKGDPRTCAILSWHGLKFGVFQFSHNQNNPGSGPYVTCIYCSLSVKINMRKTPHGEQGLWTHLFCICFCMCGRQSPEDPQFEHHGWRHHYKVWNLSCISVARTNDWEWTVGQLNAAKWPITCFNSTALCNSVSLRCDTPCGHDCVRV